MTEVLSPAAPSTSPSPPSQAPETPRVVIPPLPQPRAKTSERSPSYAQQRMSQYSRASNRSRSRSTAQEFPAFPSSLSYSLVRDFAYPVFNPLHYGATLEPSGASTPASDSQWDSARRSSDPLEQWNGNVTTHTSGWSAGPWGGDGVLYGDPKQDEDLAALPSTSFAHDEADDSALPLDLEGDDLLYKKEKQGKSKSKSYASSSEFERGRRRESGRRAQQVAGDSAMFMCQGQQSDPAGRDRLRVSRGAGQSESTSGSRTDSRNAGVLPGSSFQASQASDQQTLDPDERIPLDTETSTHAHSPVRDSMGPEDEELFAGPSLALYSFEPENSNELRLVEGQEIMVSYRHGQGWLVASDPRSGEQGLVPEAYVRLIADMPNYDPETGEFVDVDSEIEESFDGTEVTDVQQTDHEDLRPEQSQYDEKVSSRENGKEQEDVPQASKEEARTGDTSVD